MPRTLTQEIILKLKNQLSAMPDTEDNRKEREKSGEYNKWDTIKSWFDYGMKRVERTAKQINDVVFKNENIRSYVKEEQLQAFRQKADELTTYALYIIIIFAIIFVFKLIRKFFNWAKKKNNKKLSKPEPTTAKNNSPKPKKATPPRNAKGRFIRKIQTKTRQKSSKSKKTH